MADVPYVVQNSHSGWSLGGGSHGIFAWGCATLWSLY